jgi:hypothetical protein
LRRALAALLATAALAGCGAPSADLFEVRRTGPDRPANVTMVVSDGGNVTCNGAKYPLDAKRLLRARELARELAKQAELGIELPPGPGANLSYRVRMQEGSVSFSDTSKGNPPVFFAIAAFTKDVTERVCGIVR